MVVFFAWKVKRERPSCRSGGRWPILVASFHSRNGLSREPMGDGAATAFDRAGREGVLALNRASRSSCVSLDACGGANPLHDGVHGTGPVTSCSPA